MSTTSTSKQQVDEQVQVSVYEQQLRELKEEIAKLRSIQDKPRLLAADQNFTADKRPMYRYRVLDGKVVVAWGRMVINDVRIVKGDIVENQVVNVIFADGTNKEYSYKDFNDGYSLSEYTRAISLSVRDEGRVIELETPEGVISFNEKFLN